MVKRFMDDLHLKPDQALLLARTTVRGSNVFGLRRALGIKMPSEAKNG